MTLLTTDLIAIMIALGGLIYVTFLGLFQLRKLEIENQKLRSQLNKKQFNFQLRRPRRFPQPVDNFKAM